MEYGVCFDFATRKVLFNDSLDDVYFKIPIALVDIYYGISSSSRVSSDYIKSNFLTTTGNIGDLSGRSYIFPTGFSYKYWCIPDEPNIGTRVISEINNGTTTTILAYDSYYKYYQTDPTPITSITYGKIIIDGTVYRIYRTIAKTSSYIEQYVYSF